MRTWWEAKHHGGEERVKGRPRRQGGKPGHREIKTNANKTKGRKDGGEKEEVDGMKERRVRRDEEVGLYRLGKTFTPRVSHEFYSLTFLSCSILSPKAELVLRKHQ